MRQTGAGEIYMLAERHLRRMLLIVSKLLSQSKELKKVILLGEYMMVGKKKARIQIGWDLIEP